MTVNNNKGNGASRKPVKLIGAAIVVAAVVFAVVWLKVVRAEDDPTAAMATFVAKRGPLTISVLEAGAIKAKEQEIIRNEVEGRTTIVQIVPEGTHVNVGDLLVQLDASSMDDEKIDQEIRVQNAYASFVDANESLAIAINQAKSDIEKADLTLKFAKQDLDVYQTGEYPNLEVAADSKVQEANEVLTRAIQTRDWSETLYKEKYLSETELLADRLAVTKSRNSLSVAENDRRLLKMHTRQRKIDQFVSDVNQAEMALERTKRKASANVLQAETKLIATEQEWKRQKDKLAKVLTQIEKATVLSPAEGMVVYATSSRGGFGRQDRQPLADGVEVWERQELIYIPKSSSSVAEVDVHEASLDKVRSGLPAIVTVDALPGKKFVGTVSRIAPLPNAQSMWMNPDLKVYTTNIDLESPDPALRSGMNCKADIIVERYKDVVYIPVQCVLRVAGQPTVHVVNNGQVEQRKVEIGLDDDINIAILSGLNEGEVVLLAPPLDVATLTPGERIPGGGDANDANDVTTQRINEKLRAANGTSDAPTLPTGKTTPAEGAEPSAMPGVGGPGQGQPGGQGFQMPSAQQIEEAKKRFESMTPEQQQQEMQKLRQQFENSMTPEQREQMRQRFQNMTPEQQEQMRQQRRGSRGEGGSRGPSGGRGGADPASGQPQGGQ